MVERCDPAASALEKRWQGDVAYALGRGNGWSIQGLQAEERCFGNVVARWGTSGALSVRVFLLPGVSLYVYMSYSYERQVEACRCP